MLIAFGYPTNDILFGDENDAVLEKYLKYLQRVPDKWQDFYEGDDDNNVAVDDEEDSNEMEDEEESYSESEAESEADYQSFRFSNSDQAEEYYYEGDEEGDADDSSEEIEEMEDMIPDKDGFDVELMMPEVSPDAVSMTINIKDNEWYTVKNAEHLFNCNRFRTLFYVFMLCSEHLQLNTF